MDRLPWKRGELPKHFVATMLEGRAEVWWKERDTSPPTWRYRIDCGKTIKLDNAVSKQQAADQATAAWPDAVREERFRVAKIEESTRLEEQIESAHHAGTVDVMAFGLGSSTYDRLIEINEFLRRKGMLEGPLKPLAEAVSEELFRRRTTPR